MCSSDLIENDNLYSTYKQLKNCPSVLTSQLFGDKLHITINNEADFEADLKREKINLKSFQKVEPSIEDVFIELILSDKFFLPPNRHFLSTTLR